MLYILHKVTSKFTCKYQALFRIRIDIMGTFKPIRTDLIHPSSWWQLIDLMDHFYCILTASNLI